MRRFFQWNCVSYHSIRFIVGCQSSIPEASFVPSFGSKRKRRNGEVVGDMKGSSNKSGDIAIDEEMAKKICYEKYGFVWKPLVVPSWLDFLWELRRIEYSWSLVPSSGGSVVFSILEHSFDGEKVLCSLRGSSRCTPIADFFECCGNLIQGSADKGFVRFVDDDGSERVLKVLAKRQLTEGNTPTHASDEPILPVLAQHDCRGTSVDVYTTELKTGLVRPLYSDLSLQTFCYAFLVSIPIFLKRTDVGIRNVDFVSKEQMRQFRFAWCFLRRELMMTAVEMSELDLLLPP